MPALTPNSSPSINPTSLAGAQTFDPSNPAAYWTALSKLLAANVSAINTGPQQAGLKSRVLTILMMLPQGIVELDCGANSKSDGLWARVNVQKGISTVQNTAEIEIIGLSQTLRLQILSQVTAYRRSLQQNYGVNILQQAGAYQPPFIPVAIYAGYTGSVVKIFQGEIFASEPTSAPPNIGVRLSAATHHQDKTMYVYRNNPSPGQSTLKEAVQWVGQQIGATTVDCQTSFDNRPIVNPFSQAGTLDSLVRQIPALAPNTTVEAYLDDNALIVRDIGKIVRSAGNPVQVSEFIGTPMWTEWGVQFTALLDTKGSQLVLAGAAQVTSLMNPGLNGTFTPYALEYNLASREPNFYVTCYAAPAAGSTFGANGQVG